MDSFIYGKMSSPKNNFSFIRTEGKMFLNFLKKNKTLLQNIIIDRDYGERFINKKKKKYYMDIYMINMIL